MNKELEALDKLNTMFLAWMPKYIREDKKLNEDLFECIKSALKDYDTQRQKAIAYKKAYEKALKEKEQDKKLCDKITRANLEIGLNNHRLNKLVEKQLNDLSKLETFVKIIKEKGLSLLHKSLIISSKSYEEYRQEFQIVKSREFKNEYYYTQEEFDFLKEEFL